MALVGFEPANLGTKVQHATSRLSKQLIGLSPPYSTVCYQMFEYTKPDIAICCVCALNLYCHTEGRAPQ